MADNSKSPIRVSDRALEMVMRDVLDGMMELSLEAAYTDSCADFQIIDITPAAEPDQAQQRSTCQTDSAEILPFPILRKAAC